MLVCYWIDCRCRKLEFWQNKERRAENENTVWWLRKESAVEVSSGAWKVSSSKEKKGSVY